MKTREIKDLHTKNANELRTMIRDAKQKYMTMKLDHSLHKLKNTSDLAKLRRAMAKMQTVLGEQSAETREEVTNG